MNEHSEDWAFLITRHRLGYRGHYFKGSQSLCGVWRMTDGLELSGRIVPNGKKCAECQRRLHALAQRPLEAA